MIIIKMIINKMKKNEEKNLSVQPETGTGTLQNT